jgi:hypothetical protein
VVQGLRYLAAALVLASASVSWSAIYINDFAATRDMPYGRGVYDPNSNYGTRTFGRVANQSVDGFIADFDRAGVLNWIQGIYNAQNAGPITDISQIGNGTVKMTLYLSAYDGWADTATAPPTVFGHYFSPGVRLSKGQGWDQYSGTYAQAQAGQPWHDSTGQLMDSIYGGFTYSTANSGANMIMNHISEQWGAADTLGGGQDVYVYDTPRPWLLETTVAWAVLKNPDVVGFSLIHDYANKPWATGADDESTGTVYTSKHGLTEYRPYLEVQIDTRGCSPPKPGDANRDMKVSFADYLIMEQNFGRSGMSWSQGDFNFDFKVNFADYLILERNFGAGGRPVMYLPADFNRDGKVSFPDYLILEANFGRTGRTSYTGDATNDGKVTFADYLILEAQFGHTAVPEPASVTLLILGGMLLMQKRLRG